MTTIEKNKIAASAILRAWKAGNKKEAYRLLFLVGKVNNY